MDYYLVIPIHNEAAYLERTLTSLLNQSLLPKKAILVNDNSTDETEEIIDIFLGKSDIFQKLNIVSSTQHLPGSKVINAFTKGLEILDDAYDFIVKLDADIVLPQQYFEKIGTHFMNDTNIGICGGFIYEQTPSGNWELNHPMDKQHVRGAFKSYSKVCFMAIGGLKNAMGWDTVDELLAKYNGFIVHTDATLKIKHLRPTGKAYNSAAKKLQGKAMYTMRYGLLITCIASIKMAVKNKSIQSFFNNMAGYINANQNKIPYIVSEEEGNYIRNLRWKIIKTKLFA